MFFEGCGYFEETNFLGLHAVWQCTEISGCTLWLKADGISGLNNGDPVDTWPDDSGNGNNATQIGVDRPTYQTGVINSLPAIYFDGTTYYMTLTSAVVMQPATVFVVVSYTAAVVNAPLLGNTNINSEYFGYYSNTIYYYSTAASLNLARPNPLAFEIITGFAPAGSGTIRINASDYVTGNFNWGASSFLYIGRRSDVELLEGYIAEIVYYNRALDAAEIQLVENYLNNRGNCKTQNILS